MALVESRKVAFVTGAGSGIGKATATAFADRGYATVLADYDAAAGRHAEAEIRDRGGECLFTHCDVTNSASVEQALEQTLGAYGRLDAAFNAAGIQGEVGKLTAECSDENWAALLAVNLTGVWHCMRSQIRTMLKTGGGAIVNCASTAGIRGAAYCGAYTASKHGVVGLTKAAALEYASQGIRINAICPGMINTPMTQDPGMKQILASLIVNSPLQRIGQPEENGAAVLWLCGDDATFVHGQAIAVDGALTSR